MSAYICIIELFNTLKKSDKWKSVPDVLSLIHNKFNSIIDEHKCYTLFILLH